MKNKSLTLVALIATFGLITFCAHAQIATKVSWHILPTTLPDTIHLEFGTARDNWLTPLSMGTAPTTGTRIGNATAIEIRDVFEVPDMCVATNAGLKFWRGTFGPPAPYSNMTGSRIYGTAIGVGMNGMISLSGISQRTLCDKLPLLNNQSAFTGLGYSVSRIGIQKGPDGILFNNDDVILKTGQSGTNLVDAVVLIGTRLGANANSLTDIEAINTLVTTNGARITFEYYFNNSAKGSGTAMLYPAGSIPNEMCHMHYFSVTPDRVLFSLIGPTNSGPFTIHSARAVTGPWSQITTTGTEGSSVYFQFTGNSTNDQGYVKWKSTEIPPIVPD